MNEFTIKDVENLSGIKAHTWRIWEQRYGIGVPQRRDSNHRFYDNDNLKQILRISYLYHSGVKISKIAALNSDEIKNKALSSLSLQNENDFYINELLEASIDLDEERFELTFQKAIKKFGIEDTVLKILYPFQYKIGVLWLTDHVIPAQEHFTSNIIRQKLSVAIDELPLVKDPDKKQVVLFTPEHEFHELPLQFIYYLLKKNGNKVIYFGSNVSVQSLEMYKQANTINYILCYLVTNLTSKTPNEYLSELSHHFPDQKIYMTGTQVEKVTKTPKNVTLLTSMEEALAFARG